MENIVITRLNQKWKYRELHEDYMKYRLDLFEITCLPSVLGQTFSNFLHFLVTSETLPNSILYRMESYKSTKLLFFDRDDGAQITGTSSRFLKMLNNNICNDAPFLISTTIDSDDIMRRDYLEIVNKVPVNKFPTLIRSRDYFQYGDNYSNKSIFSINPPLFSFIEKKDEDVNGFYSCLKRGHGNICEEAEDVKDINCPFIMLHHASNNCSRTKKRRKDFLKEEEEKYTVSFSEIDKFLRTALPQNFVDREKNITNYRRSLRKK